MAKLWPVFRPFEANRRVIFQQSKLHKQHNVLNQVWRIIVAEKFVLDPAYATENDPDFAKWPKHLAEATKEI